ncbi:MAG: hypothetical protein U1F39_06875 [Steroidobacteraceae bacterium]
MIKKLSRGAIVASLLVLAACAGQKEPATTAMAAAESALAAVKDDAAKYLPEELHAAEGTLASLKNSLEKGDYKAVMAGAPALMSSLDTLKSHLAPKLEEAKAAAAEWTSYATDLPKMVDAIQSRVTTLSSARTLPKGLNAAAIDTARSGLDSMRAAWADASTAFTGGNAIDALAKAKAIKAKGEEVMKLLGMTAG